MSTKVNLLTPCDPRIFVKFWGNSAQIPGKVFGENLKDIAKRLLFLEIRSILDDLSELEKWKMLTSGKTLHHCFELRY